MSDESVFLFYPNLIGYVRIALALASFAVITTHPLLTAVLYFLSAFLDAFDGHAARMFDQGTRFGAMLDQLTDRCSFVAVLMALCHFYPRPVFLFGFQLVAIIDIASHWLHLHAADLTGAQTHKASTNPILHYYYTSKPFLFLMCFGNEAFFGLLYLNAFFTGPALFGVTLIQLLAALCLPVALVKSTISLVHLVEAGQTVAAHDVERRRSRPKND